jgi:uncharacterized protein
MKRFGMWLWIIGLAVCLSGVEGLRTQAGANEGHGAPSNRHILWKVESETNTVYLLGSIHVMQEHHYPLPPLIYNLFNQSRTIMFEVDLDELSSPMSELRLLTKGFYVSEETLKTVLSPERYRTAKRLLAEQGYDIETFHRMKPWMVATAVTGLQLQKLGFDSQYGVDRHIFDKAREADVEVVGLESVEFQLGLFENLPLSVQEMFLLQSLEELKDIETRITDIIRAWEEGDVRVLETHLEGMRDYPELYHALVVSRNTNWLPKIEQRLQQKGPAFIVVGTLHLLGEEGILAGLRKKGYRVEQM